MIISVHSYISIYKSIKASIEQIRIELNNNMRCFEIKFSHNKYAIGFVLNNNMRYFEIRS